ncbi:MULTISPECIES: hypothetical protein [Streptomyces]|uniref:Uncharacterized protein n=2 Tax=Streptomyces TaxID=1883 RepID=A0ABS9JFA3_9ACTN|nr:MULTISPECIES: hypothetical protein [Streptomyces]MCE0447690.1 hypothetical protein [Streptomyces tricolor]MCG0064239.1 hypothetical protein [Streptomyces tricolor]OYP16272.1 hypothetical protein CFC35_18630 [Streptomyces sp. FBKL.4005]BCM68367.1 hypothetical protein EASAB2608_03701 [Streptomyces sp. EAS-AB2608]
MPVLALLSALLVVGFEQLVAWRFGAAGIVGVLLLTVGVKAKSPAVSSAGAVLLAVLLAGPAL